MVLHDEINEIRELNIDKNESNLVNNVVSKLEEFGEISRRNTHFMRPRYVPTWHTTNFSFAFVRRKTTSFQEIGLHRLLELS